MWTLLHGTISTPSIHISMHQNLETPLYMDMLTPGMSTYIYLELVKAHSWLIWINGVKNALILGYMVAELQQAVTNDGMLEGLHAQTSVANRKDTNSDGQDSVPSFSEEELYKHLIAFIVANDQV